MSPTLESLLRKVHRAVEDTVAPGSATTQAFKSAATLAEQGKLDEAEKAGQQAQASIIKRRGLQTLFEKLTSDAEKGLHELGIDPDTDFNEDKPQAVTPDMVKRAELAGRRARKTRGVPETTRQLISPSDLGSSDFARILGGQISTRFEDLTKLEGVQLSEAIKKSGFKNSQEFLDAVKKSVEEQSRKAKNKPITPQKELELRDKLKLASNHLAVTTQGWWTAAQSNLPSTRFLYHLMSSTNPKLANRVADTLFDERKGEGQVNGPIERLK